MDGSMTRRRRRSSLREILEMIERLEAKGLVSHDELMEVKPMLERSIKMNEKDTAMEDTTNTTDNTNRIYEMICTRIDKNFEDLKSFVDAKCNESAQPWWKKTRFTLPQLKCGLNILCRWTGYAFFSICGCLAAFVLGAHAFSIVGRHVMFPVFKFFGL